MFGGENVSLLAMTRRFVGGKPFSPATVLGKIHAREILQLLLEPKVKEILQTASAEARENEQTWESTACAAMMELFEVGELQTNAKIPETDLNSPFIFL